MPSVTLTPGSVTTVADGTVDWNTPTNAKVEDGAFANATLSGTNFTTYNLQCSNYNFAGSIPVGATPVGIQVGLKKELTFSGSTHGTLVDKHVQLQFSGAAVGSDKADTFTIWPTSLTFVYYGSSSDTWSWVGISRANICDSTFGARITAKQTSGDPATTANIDVVPITVWWSGQVSQAWPMYIDSLASVQKTSKVPFESLMSVQMTAKMLADVLLPVAKKVPMLIDSVASVAKNARIYVEALASPKVAYSIPIDNLLAVQAAWSVLVDSLGAAANSQPMLLDILTPVVRSNPLAVDVLMSTLRLAPVPIEALETLARTGTVPVEALESVLKAVNLPHESLGSVEASQSLPIDWGGVHTVSASATFPIESLGSVVSQTLLCVEALSQLSGGAVTPIEWLHTLRTNELIPVDWGALPAPAPDCIWIANPRGKIWIAFEDGSVKQQP